MIAMPVPKPKALKPGDLVRIVSPASPLKAEKLEFGTKLLQDAGYRVDVAPHALDWTNHLAGSDQDRARDLMDAFCDPEVSAVYCSRGGYGCARLFPYLDLNRIAHSEKLLIGFSDITTLHVALNNLGFPTLHGPMPLTLTVPREPWVYESLVNAVKGIVGPPSAAPRGKTIVGGVGEGQITGGCLCLLTDSFGTPNALNCEGKIILIEDVDENPHRIDAMLTAMLNEGSIKDAAGIAIGEMTRTDERCDEGIGCMPWREIVQDRLGPLGIPLIVDYPCGHMANMLTVPFGIQARLDADAGTLAYLEPLCAS